MLARIAEAKEKRRPSEAWPKSSRSACPRAGIVRPVGHATRSAARRGASLIQSVKAAAVGDGVSTAGELGRGAQDEIFWDGGVTRRTNRAADRGGITNGEPVVARAWFAGSRLSAGR